MHIIVADVTPILAQMDRDAIGTCGDRGLCGSQRIGMRAAPRIAHSGDVVDVHAEAKRCHAEFLLELARRSASSAASSMAAIRLDGSAMPLPAMS